MTIQAPGYTATRKHIEVVTRAKLDVQLNAASAITGIVVDEDRQPVAHASVSTLDGSRAGHTAKTGADGRFVLDGLRPGDFDVVATAGERVSSPLRLTLAFGATRELEIALHPSKAAITGRVVDEAERPVASCVIAIDGPVARRAVTDATGAFRVAGLVAGAYEVVATAEGFVRTTRAQIVAPDLESALVLRVERGVMSRARCGRRAARLSRTPRCPRARRTSRTRGST